jgi:ABC-type polysaccharide/polyol phosphate transport system ATPase subunit
MSDTVVRVENLGKKYIIAHQHERQQYVALRDVLADRARTLFSRRRSDTPVNREEFWALKDVSFEVKRGDRVGIIGRNGAGKSTLLKILSRITEPTEGRISIRGRVASLLEVGTGFHPELTGRENIFLNGAILGMGQAEIRRKFDEIVTFAEVERFLDTPVKRYSSGMYVRLAFAVAAHLEPDILVVDEVLAVGDVGFQRKCLSKMEDIAKQASKAILFVSHNMAAVEALCSTAIWLNQGIVQSIKSAREAVSDYSKSMYLSGHGNSECHFTTSYLDSKILLSNCRVEVVEQQNLSQASRYLKVSFDLTSTLSLSQIGIGILITHSTGLKVVNIPPRVSNFFVVLSTQVLECALEWPNISHHLSGGEYVVNLWLTGGTQEPILVATDIATFSLPPVDIFGYGVGLEYPKYGFVPAPIKLQSHLIA